MLQQELRVAAACLVLAAAQGGGLCPAVLAAGFAYPGDKKLL